MLDMGFDEEVSLAPIFPMMKTNFEISPRTLGNILYLSAYHKYMISLHQGTNFEVFFFTRTGGRAEL